jgi:hypothetical protein
MAKTSADKIREAINEMAAGDPMLKIGDAMNRTGELAFHGYAAAKRAVGPLLPGAGPKRAPAKDIELPKEARKKR